MGIYSKSCASLSAVGRVFPPCFNATAVLSKASEGTLKTCVYVEATFNLSKGAVKSKERKWSELSRTVCQWGQRAAWFSDLSPWHLCRIIPQDFIRLKHSAASKARCLALWGQLFHGACAWCFWLPMLNEGELERSAVSLDCTVEHKSLFTLL